MDEKFLQKWWARSIESREYPALLIERGKHGDSYFLINSPEDLEQRALKILTDRHEEGYWYEKPAPPDSSDNLSKEEIEKLSPKLQKEAIRLQQRYLAEHNEYLDILAEYEDIVKAIKDSDGRLAWYILDQRSDGEYESVELSTLGVLED